MPHFSFGKDDWFDRLISLQNKKDTLTCVFFVLVGEAGFEPAKSLTTDLQSAPFGRSGIPPDNIKLELVDGLEPPTC